MKWRWPSNFSFQFCFLPTIQSSHDCAIVCVWYFFCFTAEICWLGAASPINTLAWLSLLDYFWRVGSRELTLGDSNNSTGNRNEKGLKHGGGRYIHIETRVGNVGSHKIPWTPQRTRCWLRGAQMEAKCRGQTLPSDDLTQCLLHNPYSGNEGWIKLFFVLRWFW